MPVLRDRESASVDHYRRLFTRYLRRHSSDEMRAAVIGASVVAAHNTALREWLSAGAPVEGVQACVERFRRVATMLPPAEDDAGSVVDRLEAAVGRLERNTSL